MYDIYCSKHVSEHSCLPIAKFHHPKWEFMGLGGTSLDIVSSWSKPRSGLGIHQVFIIR